MNKMFPFITETWNPICGPCSNNCYYCYAKKLIQKYKMKKYTKFPVSLDQKQIKRKFKKGSFVFVQDMTDLFGVNVLKLIIESVIEIIRQNRKVQFLLLTKNPRRYHEFKLPKNVVAGVTLETNICENLRKYSALTPYHERLVAMLELDHKRKMVSIEPVMNFTESFVFDIATIRPEFVAIGYDNWNSSLPEPKLQDVLDLIDDLKEFKITVHKKTLRRN